MPWLLVEAIICDRQQEYYNAINTSNDTGESTVFIELMLSSIKASLTQVISASDEMIDGKVDKATLRWKRIEEHLKPYDYIMNADGRELCGVSTATANLIPPKLVSEGRLLKDHKNGYWIYKL